MKSSVRAWLLGLNSSYWFIPSVLTLTAFLLSLGTVWVDRSGGSQWLNALGWFEPSRPEGARALLSVIASATIAISSTVFAITIAAVVYASGNYGPRLLTNFMTDRGNQVSLGVFIATFVYNLMILRVVRNPELGASDPREAAAFVPQVSVLVSVGTMVLAVAVLVYFLHHVPASIRINSVLGGIGRRLLHDIEKRFPKEGSADQPVQPIEGCPVAAACAGYIEIIDYAELDRIACECGLRIGLHVRTGDFVHPHRPLAETSGTAPREDIERRIRACFSFGDSRTPTQDLEFLIDELVEIGLRGLSPGINDPFTAVTSLHWMGAALARLAERDLRAGPERCDYDVDRVRPIIDDFAHYVRRSFGAIRPSAAASPIAAKVFLEALEGAALSAGPARRHVLLDEGRLLIRQAETALEGPALDEVRERLQRLERQCGP